MRDKQIELLFKVLRILQKEGALKHLVVVGSWCMYFYNFYFNKIETIATLRTRDVDFMVPEPKLLDIEIDLPEILKPLGFVIDYLGEEGYMRLVHPEFFIEFLVPKKGKDSNKAFMLDSLGLNAQSLRFLDILYLKTVTIKANRIKLIVSHPASFLLHKAIIFKKRLDKNKRKQELEQMQRIFEVLQEKGYLSSVKQVFSMLHKKWQNKIITNLKEIGYDNIIKIL